MALALEVLCILGALAWFSDASQALISFGPLLLTLLVAALILRLPESFPNLQRFERGLLVGGIVVTAIILIRVLVFPSMALTDFSWLATFASLTDLYAATPHAELGMIGISVLIWLHALAIVRNGGDYAARRRQFIRILILLIVAIVLGLMYIPNPTGVSETIALYLPSYTLVGLITLSQVRLAEVRARMTRTGSRDQRTLAVWRVVTGGMALFSLLIVFVTTAIFYRGSYGRVIAALATVWGTIADALAYALGWLTYPLVFVLQNVTNRISITPCIFPTVTPVSGATSAPTPIPGIQVSPTPTGQPVLCRSGASPITTPPPAPVSSEVAHIFLVVILLLALLIVGLVLASRLRRKLTPQAGEDFDEEREGLNIRNVLREQFARATPAMVAVSDVPAPGTARAAYRAFLSTAAQAGHPRTANETPEEYQRRLQPVLQATTSSQPIDDLTREYESERYGGEQLPVGRLARVQEALHMLVAAFARLPRTRTKQEKE